MNYTGKLYGKVCGEIGYDYIPLSNTTEQFDKMYRALKEVVTDINIVGEVSGITITKCKLLIKEIDNEKAKK